ncbi:inclusion membrane protein GarD [Chlamydia pneumoniae]|nr:hypothetical protein [Chlamydia pneumoniae]AAD18394.1 hypothetical protein CPn_0241 [Chlamydia pneumoniae CWL029]AAF38347.1 hypothetical protein CP_0521 [Chlamydia pneumoniae AR39]CRI32740.1 Uncharacterized protein BN1224_Wien1_A_02470 [Chlamydia pneumoniae]CRI35603.1 Uncharacterized protein BN1224_CM1_A_02500 [Chlamydia pneumoniae]CRI36730.1 Uncharacterized protein BN1224_CV14_A_02490 [Chlamydia pneumoniae]
MSAMISLSSSHEASIASNTQVRDVLVSLAMDEFVEHNTEILPIKVFLARGTLSSTAIIDDLKDVVETEGEHHFQVYSNISLKMIYQRFFEKIFGIGCCPLLLVTDSHHTDPCGALITGIFAAVLFTVLAIVFGPTLGILCYSAYKIYQLTKKISSLSRTHTEVINSVQKSDPFIHRSGAVAAAAASQSTIKACKVFRQSTLIFFVLGLIITISLAALIVGLVFALFFLDPGAPAVMTAAMIGCCAAGGTGILLSVIGFLLASVYSVQKSQEGVHHMHTALLRCIVSNTIIQMPYLPITPGTKKVLTQSIRRYQQFFSDDEYRDIESEVPLNRQTTPPPSYETLFHEEGSDGSSNVIPRESPPAYSTIDSSNSPFPSSSPPPYYR